MRRTTSLCRSVTVENITIDIDTIDIDGVYRYRRRPSHPWAEAINRGSWQPNEKHHLSDGESCFAKCLRVRDIAKGKFTSNQRAYMLENLVA